MAQKDDIIMNGDGVAKLGFPMWPQFNETMYADVEQTLRSGKVSYWTGKRGMEFEEKWAKWCGAGYAISCTNGTAALHIAIASLNIGPGDEVIVPSYSFIASSFSIVQAGAIPVFCDTTEDHVIDPTKIEALITPRTKGIVVVHLYGIMCDMDPIMAIAKKHGLKVVEDCAQCFGGIYKGKKSGTIGDVGCFSFCQSKHFTTGGEGGMVVTSDEDTAWECRSFRDHGYDVKTRMNMLALEQKLPYIHNRVGFNYRMTEMQSVIGLHELERFDNWNMARRKQYAAMYDEAFKGLDGIERLPLNTPDRQCAYWWYPINLDPKRCKLKASEFIDKLAAAKIPCSGILWPEAYLENAYSNHVGFGTAKFPFESKEYTDAKSVDYKNNSCPVAASLRDVTVSLFLHPSWEPEHIQRCIDVFKQIMSENLK